MAIAYHRDDGSHRYAGELIMPMKAGGKVEFEPGDIVQLKSGGPPMTVERIGKEEKTGEDTVSCTWFEKSGKNQQLQRETFNPVLLQKYEPAFGFISGPGLM
jgi:uncharacterized protein YodC (DUF2158 family)